MNRSLKALGLGLLAVFALSAVMASAASAEEYPVLTPVPAEYPVTLKGAQVGNHKFTLPGNRNFECTTVKFEGSLASEADATKGELTVDPTYEGCTAEILGVKNPVTVTFNSCDYLLTSDSTTTGAIAAEGWEVTGSVHIKCDVPGDKIEVHVWQPGKNHATDATLCTYTIAAQDNITSLDYKLEEKDAEGNGTSGTIRATATNIAVTKSSGTLTNCGSNSQVATYVGDTKVEGFNNNNEMLKGKWEEHKTNT